MDDAAPAKSKSPRPHHAGHRERLRAEPTAADLTPLEGLYAASATAQGLVIRAAASGCTSKADFAFFIERRENGAAGIAFARKPDAPCRLALGAAGHVDLRFSYAELGVSPDAPLFLLNPIASPPAAHARARR